jgi:hypothetical protein
LEPLQDYSAKDINDVIKDPLYKEFLEFKEEINYKLMLANQQLKNEERSDYFLRS